jgi:Na+-transporting methylmalonyl-CoA/oxaloacetate decarboxylase beta subunit
MTDFGPLLENPKMVLLGAAGQFGIFADAAAGAAAGFHGRGSGVDRHHRRGGRTDLRFT